MHISDLPVTQAIQMTEGKLRRSMVIQNYIGHARNLGVAGDRDRGGREGALELSIDRQNAVHAARLQEAGILRDKVFSVPVVRGEEEVALFHQDLRRAAEHLRMIALAELGKQDADGVCV